jgi:hypothetical protein
MSVKIILSIGYVILFGVLGRLASLVTHPPHIVTVLAFISLVFFFAYTWLGDTVSRGNS